MQLSLRHPRHTRCVFSISRSQVAMLTALAAALGALSPPAQAGATDEFHQKRKQLNEWAIQNPNAPIEEFRKKEQELMRPAVKNFTQTLTDKIRETSRRERQIEARERKEREAHMDVPKSEVDKLQKQGKLPADLKRAAREAKVPEKPKSGKKGAPAGTGLTGLKLPGSSPRPTEPLAAPTRTGPVLDGSNIPKELTFSSRKAEPSPSPSPGLVLDGKAVPKHLEFLSRPPASPGP